MKADYHIHSAFSTDAKASAEEMIQGALKKGLEEICFTDHYDEEYPEKNEFIFDLEAYGAHMEMLQEKYKEQLRIKIGVEIGLQKHLGDFYHKFTKAYPFDFVIGSIHTIDGKDPYFPGFFEHISDEKGYQRTFEETLESLKTIKDFDVLGHMDYIVRYGKEKEAHYNCLDYKDLFDEILKMLIHEGKGIELNMAGLKYGLSFAHPHPYLLKRYKELGGEIITIGSDAHCPEHIGYDFYKAKSLLENNGFKYYTEFSKRKPKFKQL